MAKGKGAVALFEVINKDKRIDARVAQKPPVPPAPAKVSPDLVEKAVDLWRKRHSDPESWTNSPVKIRKSLTAQFSTLREKMRQAIAALLYAGRSTQAWVIRQNSVVCGAAAALLVIGALTAVRHWYHPVATQTPIEQALLNGPTHPAVLAVAREETGQESAPAPATASLSPEMQADVQQASSKVEPTATQSNLAAPGARVVNMHYVLMQSYFEQKTAEEARDFLNRNGIPCTIERGVKGWRSDFYEVIGLQGFTRASGPEYIAYRTKVIDLGVKFSPKSRYKRFQPQALKW